MTEPADMNVPPREAVRSLRVLFGTLVGAVVLFATGVVLILLLNGSVCEPDSPGQSNLLVSVAAVVSLACVAGAWNYYNKTLSMGAGNLFSLADKLNHYRAAMIIYMALCEGPAIFSVIVMLLTGKYITLVIIALLVAVMCLKMPTRNRIIQELKLDWREQQEIGK